MHIADYLAHMGVIRIGQRTAVLAEDREDAPSASVADAFLAVAIRPFPADIFALVGREPGAKLARAHVDGAVEFGPDLFTVERQWRTLFSGSPNRETAE
jgi:hypothetical protein